MKIIGKIGSIILTPFHLLYNLWVKIPEIIVGILPILYCMLVIYDIYCLYLSYQEETLGNFIYLVFTNVIMMGAIGAIMLLVNAILCKLLSYILAVTEVVYEQCIAWRDGISVDELAGRLAYKEEKRKSLIRAKEEKKKAEAEEKQRKKEEAFKKGFANAYAKDTVNSESFKKQTEDQTQQKSQTESTQEEFFKDQQRQQQQAYEEQRWKAYEEQQRKQQEEQKRRAYEEQQRRQQEQQRNQQFRTSYDDKLENALTTLHLKKGCSFDEVKNNYRMLAKMFHPDSGNSKFDTNEAQLKINEAYDFLKKHYEQK